MSSGAKKTKEQEPRDRLRQMAQEVMSEISELDPSRNKELLGVFVSELFLSVAEQESRRERCQRQAEAVAAAKARGVRFGRERMELPDGFEDLVEDWSNGLVTASEAGRMLGISRHTFTRRAKEMVQSAEEASVDVL